MGGRKRRSKKPRHSSGSGRHRAADDASSSTSHHQRPLPQPLGQPSHQPLDHHKTHDGRHGQNSDPNLDLEIDPDYDDDYDMIDATAEPCGAELHLVTPGDDRLSGADGGPSRIRTPIPSETPIEADDASDSGCMDLDVAPPSPRKPSTPEPRQPPAPQSPRSEMTRRTGLLFAPECNTRPESDEASIYSPIRYPSGSGAYQGDNSHADSHTITSSRSLWAEDLDYFYENGRRYCGTYFMPNDLEEQDRLRIVHQVYLSVFDLELTTVLLDDPTYILDIGTGTGEWAIGMGESFPQCEVVGTDISAIQPSAVPHNVFFEIDDAELEWTRPENHADLIHLRNLAGAFADWGFVYQQAYRAIKPGGYIEILDFDDHKGFRNFFSFFPADSEILALAQDLGEASVRAGRPRSMAHLDPRALIDAGFVDVTQTEHAIPLSPVEMSTGKLWLVACLCSLESLSLRLLTTYMGWNAERVRRVCDDVAEELKEVALNNPDRAKEVVVKVRIIVGRKPEVEGQWSAQSIQENGDVGMQESGEDSGS